MSIKLYQHCPCCKTLHNLPKFGFLVCKYTLWQPRVISSFETTASDVTATTRQSLIIHRMFKDKYIVQESLRHLSKINHLFFSEAKIPCFVGMSICTQAQMYVHVAAFLYTRVGLRPKIK
jgi:hypothetical protein